MKTVLIEVTGGVAEIIRSPKEVTVEIIDLDLLRGGDFEDVKHYWNDVLSAAARRYIKQRYPKVFAFLTTEFAR
jgi:hypothetical protein